MATINKQSRAWGARVRRNGTSLTKTFFKKTAATHWAMEMERSIYCFGTLVWITASNLALAPGPRAKNAMIERCNYSMTGK